MMKITLDVPEYTVERGIRYKWEYGFDIESRIDNGVIVISANREGLISLANHLLNLSQAGVPLGHHLHLDEYNSLEEGSSELIIVRK